MMKMEAKMEVEDGERREERGERERGERERGERREIERQDRKMQLWEVIF